jgi:hypothetical protein
VLSAAQKAYFKNPALTVGRRCNLSFKKIKKLKNKKIKKIKNKKLNSKCAL